MFILKQNNVPLNIMVCSFAENFPSWRGREGREITEFQNWAKGGVGRIRLGKRD